jgi:hypothetical protein
MDKLTCTGALMRPGLQVVTVLALLLAALGQPPPAAAGETFGADARAASGLSAAADLAWISGLDDDIRDLGGADSIPRSRILEEIGGIWRDRIKGMASDSLSVAASSLEKILRLQIDYITSLLEPPPQFEDDTGTEARLDEAVGAIKALSNLSPLALARRDSMRSALLVVSSVGCACEMERCSKMIELFASMQADTLGGPAATVDLMQVPPLENLLGYVTIPYWIFFDEIGEVSTVIEGASDAEDVRAGIVSWLGLRRAESRKDGQADGR